ncbi:NAD(P)H-dependent oxidoreductase [Roseibium sp. SCPC15]|uniref:FMN-dependent NADH-azoreductase n=1 Tax=Roseibium sp. SCP15 TaxID=3141376 RepID=UPI00333D6FE5
MKVLRLDTSAQIGNSHSRALTARFIAGLGPDTEIVQRDLAKGIPLIGPDWFNASFTPADNRDNDQEQSLSASQELVEELQEADLLVIGLPIYNFGVPASLKLWIDQVCRANLTFKHTPEGSVGLLEGKRAVVIYVSGGTPFESDADFATDYLRYVLGFIGIKDVHFIKADAHMSDESSLPNAQVAADQLSKKIGFEDETALVS